MLSVSPRKMVRAGFVVSDQADSESVPVPINGMVSPFLKRDVLRFSAIQILSPSSTVLYPFPSTSMRSAGSNSLSDFFFGTLSHNPLHRIKESLYLLDCRHSIP